LSNSATRRGGIGDDFPLPPAGHGWFDAALCCELETWPGIGSRRCCG
jgi:hypothetical protein